MHEKCDGKVGVYDIEPQGPGTPTRQGKDCFTVDGFKKNKDACCNLSAKAAAPTTAGASETMGTNDSPWPRSLRCHEAAGT